MRGAVAAGHQLTAEAGAQVLEEGGNAVDACIAAAFVSWVAESPLTGPGAGGFMLVHRADDRSMRVLDHFVTVPGLGLRRPGTNALDSVGVDFTPESSQFFRIGPASCAVPGAAAGLGEAHRRFASLPWRTLLEPAIAHAREGVALNEGQAYLHTILDPILRHTNEGGAMYSLNGQQLVAGDRLVLDDLARTLEQLAEKGAADLYTGELARELSRHLREGGGDITLRDLREYRVIQRRPVRVRFLGHEFHSNPPPSRGGVLIGLGLQLFDRLRVAGPPGSAESMAQLVEIMWEQEAATDGRFSRELYRGGLASRLSDPRQLAAATRRIRSRLPELQRGTTHISVVDAQGNAASLTASTGAGSGVIVPGTGIQLNNMLAEILEKVGKDGVVTIEEGKGTQLEVEYTEGMQFDRGYISPYFISNAERMESELDEAAVLITDRKISAVTDILPLLEKVLQGGRRNLLILAEDVDGEALAMLVVNKMRGTLNVLAVKAPGFGDRRKEMLRDIATLTGAQVVSEEIGRTLDSVTVADLGSARRVVSTKDDTTFVE